MGERHPLSGCTLSFIGAGSMAEALLKGLLSATPVRAASLRLTNRQDRQRLETLAERYGVTVCPSKAEAAGGAQIVLVAVKPQDMEAALAELKAHLQPDQLVISVAAGVPMARVQQALGGHKQLVRAMPNTSCAVREGAIGIAYSPQVSERQRAMARAIFAAVGETVDVDEGLLDAVTGLSGSGPAYVYCLAEALADAGRQVGLPGHVAQRLALQTVIGAGRMLEGGADPEALRRQVMSPGGTTEAGLEALLDAGFAQAVAAAVERATERSAELAAAGKSDDETELSAGA